MLSTPTKPTQTVTGDDATQQDALDILAHWLELAEKAGLSVITKKKPDSNWFGFVVYDVDVVDGQLTYIGDREGAQ